MRRAGVVLAVGSGGALGAVGRYEIGMAWPTAAGRFPFSTCAVNLSGAMVLGAVVTLVVERWPPTRYVRPFAGIGLCGGFTTWSTFMVETALLARDGRSALAAAYVAVSLAGGLLATWAGAWLGRLWPVERRRAS